MTPARVLVALPTYNEIETLPELVDNILRALPQADLLVVDDNSPDGTGRWCDERAAGEPRIACLHRPGKLGLGSATLAAARHAMEHGYDVFVTLDADGSHEPRHLPELVRATETADVAIGSRYCAGGAIENWPWGRRLVSRSVNAVSRRLLCLPVRDASGAYRAYRVAALRRLELDRIEARGYSFLEELVWHLAMSGTTFVEVPIQFRPRQAGRSKAGLREAFGKLGTIVKLGARRLWNR
jgi:dolichol-phosphate mannosyltransferase